MPSRQMPSRRRNAPRQPRPSHLPPPQRLATREFLLKLCLPAHLVKVLTAGRSNLRSHSFDQPGELMPKLVGGAPLPNQPFPRVALRGGTLLPGVELTLTIGRARSLALVATLHEGDVIGVVAQRNSVEEPTRE